MGSCVKMTFTTGSKDTVRILDIDDYCVLAESVYASFTVPEGTRWVLPIKNIVSIEPLR